MGAFVIFDIRFEEKKDRDKFEKKYGIKKIHILVDEGASASGFAWMFLRDVNLNPIYFMGFMGYCDPYDILKECLEEGIKIKFLSWIPINDKKAEWEKIRGRW